MNNNLKATVNIFGSRTLAIVSCVAGWVASAYLFYRTIQLNKGPTSQIDLCKTIFGGSCDGALSNVASWQLGYPIAGWGMVYFGLIALLIVFNKPAVDRIIILLGSLGLGISIILSSAIISQGLSCPLCLGIHIINLVVLISIYVSARSRKVSSDSNQSAFSKLSLRWGILVVLTTIIGGFSEVYILANSIGTSSKVSLNQSYEDFHNGPVLDFPKNSLSYKTGLVKAPLHVVVFSSFQCPGCQVFDNSLTHIRKKFGENIRIDYKHFPLSSSCNPKINVDMQPSSCDAALAAIAAGNQGHYWEYHEQLFKSNLEANDSILSSIAKSVGLNLETWESDRHSEGVKISLMDDINFANAIEINSTPSVFLNGRKVKRHDEASFTYLLYEELNHLSK